MRKQSSEEEMTHLFSVACPFQSRRLMSRHLGNLALTKLGDKYLPCYPRNTPIFEMQQEGLKAVSKDSAAISGREIKPRGFKASDPDWIRKQNKIRFRSAMPRNTFQCNRYLKPPFLLVIAGRPTLISSKTIGKEL